jgi:hypothetical protein
MTNLGMVIDEIAKFMNEHLSKVVKEEPVKSKLKDLKHGLTINNIIISDYKYLVEETERLHNEQYTDEEIVETMTRWIHEKDCLNSECPARTQTTVKNYGDDKCAINHISIYLSSDAICRIMCQHPECSTNDIINHYKLAVRHEYGHFIDYVMLNGTSYSEFVKKRKEEHLIEKDVYKRMDEFKEKANKDDKISQQDLIYTCNRMYYEEIPTEKKANEYAKFTPEELERLYTNDGLN